MKHIHEYLLGKGKTVDTIYATNDSLRIIIKEELDRLGHDADLNHIDVSEVTNMDHLFSCGNGYDYNLDSSYKDLNPDVSEWDVKKVKNMSFMFCGCENFNCDITGWDVSNVEDMDYMFYDCQEFNQPIGEKWKIKNDTRINFMFFNCYKFEQDLSNWTLHGNRAARAFEKCPIEYRYNMLPKFN